MRSLVIDIGNTFIKTALFTDQQISELKITEEIDVPFLEGFIGNGALDAAIISSVEREAKDIERYLQSRCRYVRFNTGLSGRIQNKYRTPGTLGADRLAAVIGAEALYTGRNVLVIDAGTCITYDFVDSERNYYGGSISPGIAMRFRAMNSQTSRLPLVEPDESFTGWYGYDTRTAMISGVQQGVYNEALGFIGLYSDKYPRLQVLLCGGDAGFFDSRLKNSIFAHSFKTEPHLVLTGLNEVILSA